MFSASFKRDLFAVLHFSVKKLRELICKCLLSEIHVGCGYGSVRRIINGEMVFINYISHETPCMSVSLYLVTNALQFCR